MISPQITEIDEGNLLNLVAKNDRNTYVDNKITLYQTRT